MFYSYFTHPNSVCMSYFKHMTLSLKFSFYMIKGSCMALVHAFFPSLFITGTTDTNKIITLMLIDNGCRKGQLDH